MQFAAVFFTVIRLLPKCYIIQFLTTWIKYLLKNLVRHLVIIVNLKFLGETGRMTLKKILEIFGPIFKKNTRPL